MRISTEIFDSLPKLNLFLKTLTPKARLLLLAMIALSNLKKLDQPTTARIAEIARTMGYKPDKSGKFSDCLYEGIIKTVWCLKVKCIDIFIREPAGKRTDGRHKYRTGIITLSILQEFQAYYEEDGQPINNDKFGWSKKYYNEYHLRKPLLHMIPMTDEKGNILKARDGSIRLRRATEILWRFDSRFVELAKDKETTWVVLSDAIKIFHKEGK